MLRFLIADDDEVIHAYLRHVLLSLGDVHHAFSGEEALDITGDALERAEPFSCVFMDVLMPGLSGVETLPRIKAMHSMHGFDSPKCIMISCLTQAQCQVETGCPSPADSYIHKPFDRSTVLNTLTELGFAPAATDDETTW